MVEIVDFFSQLIGDPHRFVCRECQLDDDDPISVGFAVGFL